MSPEFLSNDEVIQQVVVTPPAVRAVKPSTVTVTVVVVVVASDKCS